jgi:hypothetical protein
MCFYIYLCMPPFLTGGAGFEHPKLFYCYCCVKLMLMIRLKVCEVCDIYALGYELRVE